DGDMRGVVDRLFRLRGHDLVAETGDGARLPDPPPTDHDRVLDAAHAHVELVLELTVDGELEEAGLPALQPLSLRSGQTLLRHLHLRFLWLLVVEAGASTKDVRERRGVLRLFGSRPGIG